MAEQITWSSETVLFIGAGATALLGMPQSDLQTKIFRGFAERKSTDTLEDILSDSTPQKIFGKTPPFKGRDLKIMAAFIRFLGDDLKKDWNTVDEEDIKNGRIVFGDDTDEKLLRSRIMELRREYDWNALKQIIQVCPHDEREDNLIRDIYTMIDMKLRDRQGITVRLKNEKGTPSEVIIEPNRLPKARNCLVLFTCILFANAWYGLSKGENAEMFQKYVNFMESLARLMQKEGGRLADKGYEFNTPAFYRLSNAVVTLNFETVFLWLLFNANRKVNHEGYYLPQTAQKVEQWLDFGVPGKSRKISPDDNARKPGEFSYSQSETSVFRGNEYRTPGSPIGRIGSFLFAHGCCNWRECPACGRMMYYLGDEWGYKSRHVNPPFPVPLFENNDFNRTAKEKEWKAKLRYDSLECISCGAETRACDAPMIMQTMIKGMPTSFLEEVQRESRVLLRKARHVVLFGYQLPPDDILWQEAFSEAIRYRKDTDDAAYCTVVVGHWGDRRWLYGDEMMEYVKKYRYTKDAVSYGVKAIVNAVSIFGKEYVRAWCGGIPQVFADGDEAAVKEILFPNHFVNWKGTRLEK
ncbi:hypothetical protein [uncultured Fibrobacter sp.]|uniref:hypothetical protein n=1 Tax=uncultured Fibrobacter sp. TaxID=261512 RepID=UPI00259291D7|nr:hypothetical protein [uncultured Fibrobacter sp.]